MRSELDKLLERGAAMRRAGSLEAARDCYMIALEQDPYYRMTYISLGKAAHLLGAQNLAVRCYLASMHLQIASVEPDVRNHNLPAGLRAQYDSLPKELLASLPGPSAFMIYLDVNTPRHAAHAILDLSEDFLATNPELEPFAEAYRAHIYGNGTHEQVLARHRLTVNDQIQSDEQVYIPYGRKLLLEEMQWNEAASRDVLRIYFKNDELEAR